MLRRFLNWRKTRRVRRQAHDLAWLPAIATTPDGLSAFIHLARDALESACDDLQFEVRGTSEKYLCGTSPSTTAIVYLHGDGAQIHDGERELFWSEYYDYDTPAQLVERLVESVENIMSRARTVEESGASRSSRH
jgi:hypothetical protein